MRTLTKAVALVMIAILGLSACGGDATAAKVKTNLKASILAEAGADKAAALTADQSGCIANKMVDGLGVKKLQDYGLVNKDLTIVKNTSSDGSSSFLPTGHKMSRPDATTVVDGLFSCIPAGTFQKMMTAGMGAGVTAAQKECITKAITDDVLKKTLIDAATGNTDAVKNAVMGPAMGCMFGGASTQ